jgi:hypothetical protein
MILAALFLGGAGRIACIYFLRLQKRNLNRI